MLTSIIQEEVVRKTQSFDKLKQESEKCLQQSERFNNEKAEFEEATFSKVKSLRFILFPVYLLLMITCYAISYGIHRTLSLYIALLHVDKDC
jgi:hypothetical protein